MYEGLTARDKGYESNKDVIFKNINGIHIENFRTLKNRYIPLGENITLLSGKNGTMKTSLLGLIAHPFSSKNDAKDIFGDELKTPHSNVFKLSLDKDIEDYKYYIHANSITGYEFYEPVRMYLRENEKRHRVTVGKDNSAGLGNFYLNTSYVNFKRLYPMIETQATEQGKNIVVSKDMINFINDGHMKIMNRNAYSKAIPVAEMKGHAKSTFGPSEQYYDFSSMSSGEDNLGHILSRMYAFQSNRYNDHKNQLNGIFCIDEIEAGLHPVAQEKLFEFIFAWSKEYNIQVVATTHSLYLIQYVLMKREINHNFARRIQVNMISTAHAANRNYNIIPNPDYKQAYKELTFKTIEELEDGYKINILCEDDVAEYYMKRIVRKKVINDRLNYLSGITNDDSNSGTGWKSLKSLITHGAELVKDSIIVFDADVPKSITSNKVRLLWLPSMENLPVEKEIVKFIYDLNDDDAFFIKFDHEKEAFLSEFYTYNLTMLDDLSLIKDSNTDKFKNWAKSKGNFKSYVTYYVGLKLDYVMKFRKDLIKSINEILKDKSLPTFDEE